MIIPIFFHKKSLPSNCFIYDIILLLSLYHRNSFVWELFEVFCIYFILLFLIFQFSGGHIMKLQRLYSLVRQAIDDYQMIQDGDKIAIGISGGKDSLTLLYALAGLRRFYPASFKLSAITVDLGFQTQDLSQIKALCDTLDVPFYIVKTEIGPIIFDKRKESNPCALCSKMRKGALHQKILDIGYNKVAYAHHMDDAVETFMLSMFYEGRLLSFEPVTKFDKTKITLIRPLTYVHESEVKGFVHKYNLPVMKSPCPVDGLTKRESMHQLLQQINKENPGICDRIFHAMQTDMDVWKVHDDAK